MKFLILVLVVSVLLFIYIINKHKIYSFIDIIGVFFCVFLPTLFGMVLLNLFISNITFNDSDFNFKERHEYWIYSLNDNSTVKGNFVLGGGTVKEETVYSFYIKSKYGYSLEKVLTSETAIREVNSRKPEIISLVPEFKNEKLKSWFFPKNPEPKYIIYVPKNTVIKNFTLDSNY